jgi:thiamine-phosphate pyrophosphorylase
MAPAISLPMRARHRLPDIWLFTDERQGVALWAALAALPRGAGVIFRHYAAPDRAALARAHRAVCRRRGLCFVVAGPPRLARAWHAAGAHGRAPGTLTAPAHDAAELVAARRAGARLAFLSPLYATRSHPGARPLGRLRFGGLVRGAPLPVAALGGVGPRDAAVLRRLGAVGWAAIDAWHERPRRHLGRAAGPTGSDATADMGSSSIMGGTRRARGTDGNGAPMFDNRHPRRGG